MIHVVVILFWLSLLVGTLLTHNPVANWAAASPGCTSSCVGGHDAASDPTEPPQGRHRSLGVTGRFPTHAYA